MYMSDYANAGPGGDGRLPTPTLLLVIVGVAVGFLWAALQRSHWWLALFGVAFVLNVLMIVVVRRRNASPGPPGRPTGRVLTPVQSYSSALPYRVALQPTRWVGGANVPGALGRMNASTPLAVLELTNGTLTLRVRPRFLGTLLGAQIQAVTASAVIEMFPAKGKLMFGWQGIGVQPFGRRVFYFWTRQPAEILTALAAAHFPVSWAERHVRYRGAG
jgi:hypothetical protein